MLPLLLLLLSLCCCLILMPPPPSSSSLLSYAICSGTTYDIACPIFNVYRVSIFPLTFTKCMLYLLYANCECYSLSPFGFARNLYGSHTHCMNIRTLWLLNILVFVVPTTPIEWIFRLSEFAVAAYRLEKERHDRNGPKKASGIHEIVYFNRNTLPLHIYRYLWFIFWLECILCFLESKESREEYQNSVTENHWVWTTFKFRKEP